MECHTFSLGAGPILFIMCAADLISVIESYGFHVYADDKQMYGSCRPATVHALSSKISECVGAVAS